MKAPVILNLTKSVFATRLGDILESINGSPLKKRKFSIVNKAMVQLIYGDNDINHNEHNLDNVFVDSFEPEANDEPAQVYNIIVKTFVANDSGTGMELEDVSVSTALNCTAYTKELKRLFNQYLPDNDSTCQDIIDSSLVQNWIREEESKCDEFDDESETPDLESELAEKDLYDLTEWLLETFDIDDLVDDDFLGELTMNTVSIELSFPTPLV